MALIILIFVIISIKIIIIITVIMTIITVYLHYHIQIKRLPAPLALLSSVAYFQLSCLRINKHEHSGQCGMVCCIFMVFLESCLPSWTADHEVYWIESNVFTITWGQVLWEVDSVNRGFCNLPVRFLRWGSIVWRLWARETGKKQRSGSAWTVWPKEL